jgi:decaprenyl-phosphate phosphoribosyltransferase
MSLVYSKQFQASYADYLTLMRPGYWFKNIFMLPGIIMAFMFSNQLPQWNHIFLLSVAVISTCMVASANYVINEWLDAEFDRHHPTKKTRPSVTKAMDKKLVYTIYIFLAAGGILIASYINQLFMWVAVWLLFMGILYNVKPFRTKERAYLDVLSEAVNNPIRFLLGWLVIMPEMLPPASILFAYWMGGAFLMGCKRLAEYRFINDPLVASQYRRSFARYSELSLLVSIFFYALTATFFLGIFLIKHRIELLLTFPLFALLFSWYLHITHRPDSTAQRPEKLYTNWKFMIFILLFFLFFMALLFIDIRQLDYFLGNDFN